MGWTQWALFKFSNKTYDYTLKLKFPDTSNHWGWTFEDNGNTSNRNAIEYSTIEAKDIGPQNSYSYGHTGKENEWAGMKGTVEVYTKNGTQLGDKICKVFYSCPWAGKNEFSVSDVKDGWKIESWGADFNGDALGSITMEIRKP